MLILIFFGTIELLGRPTSHRIGQTKPVLVCRLATANTVDQKVVERAAAKRRLEKLVIHKGKFKTGIKSFSKSLAAVTPDSPVAKPGNLAEPGSWV